MSAIPLIKEFLKTFNIPIIFADGYEADDVIGTISKLASQNSYEVYMYTPDKDFAQLVSENVYMYRPGQRGADHQIWDTNMVCEKFEINNVSQVIDYLGMVGDAVDNIPGISGVGPKTASKLLTKYGSMEGVYSNIGDLKGKLKENIVNGEENAKLSKKLATILVNVPVEFNYNELELTEPNWENVKLLFEKLEFRRIYDRAYKFFHKANSDSQNFIETENLQLSLFSEPTVNENIKIKKSTDLDTEKKIKGTVKSILNSDIIYISHYIENSNLHALSISFDDKSFHVLIDERLTSSTVLKLLEPVFSSREITKVFYDSKTFLKCLMIYNIEFSENFFDILIADYVIDPENNHSIENIFIRHNLNNLPILKTQLGLQAHLVDYLNIISNSIPVIYEKQNELLGSNKLKNLFLNVEQPLVEVLIKMELYGVNLDTTALKNYSNNLNEKINLLKSQIFNLSEISFNISSPKQLGEILFEKLKLSDKPKKTKSGQYSTNEMELLKLKKKHPIIEKVLDYRTLQKLLNTYVDALPSMINQNDKKIHTSFNNTVTNTGRLSSSSPNLQNIPIRKDSGKDVRRAFVPSNSDHILMAADYSQIELRLIAELSNEEKMIAAFLKGEDIHRSTASKVFKVSLDNVSDEMRSNAKVVNFGIIYGVSAFGLSEQSTLTRKEASELIKLYFLTYPKLKAYIEEQISFAQKNGYVQTLLGRKRQLRNINSRNSFIRSHDERNAVNMPIQGSAADLIKLSMINIDREFQAKSIKSKMILQVHDELVFDVLNSERKIVEQIVRDKMENVYYTRVPLKVDIGFGEDWLEAH